MADGSREELVALTDTTKTLNGDDDALDAQEQARQMSSRNPHLPCGNDHDVANRGGV